MKKRVCFKLLVRLPSGHEYWEPYRRQVGESHFVPGHGRQPEFSGCITTFGKAIVAWFNEDEPKEKHRTFVRAEMMTAEEAQRARV